MINNSINTTIIYNYVYYDSINTTIIYNYVYYDSINTTIIYNYVYYYLYFLVFINIM